MELEQPGAGALGSWSYGELEQPGAGATGSWSYGELELRGAGVMKSSGELKLLELELRGAGEMESWSDKGTRKLSCRRYVASAQEGHVYRRLLKMVFKW
jgi:hypothetical protein